MSETVEKHHCVGCRDDFYNHGNHSTDGKCWLLDKAKLVKRWRLGWWTAPTEPGAFVEVIVPDCYHQPGKYAYCHNLPDFVKLEDVRPI